MDGMAVAINRNALRFALQAAEQPQNQNDYENGSDYAV